VASQKRDYSSGPVRQKSLRFAVYNRPKQALRLCFSGQLYQRAYRLIADAA
jgi:hypothetical protein